MKIRLAAALLLLPSALLVAQPGPVQSALLGVRLPDSTTLSKSFVYRMAAKGSVKVDASGEGVTLGSALEVYRLVLSGPTQPDILASVQAAGWTVTPSAKTATVAIADKAGAPSVLLSFINGRKDRYLYVAEIAQRTPTPAVTQPAALPVIAGTTPQSAQTLPDATTPPPPAPAQQTPPAPVAPDPGVAPALSAANPGGYAFNTTNFDDGWTGVIGDGWVKLSKGDMRVLLHHKRAEEDTYMSVLEEQTRLFWNLLVAPRYRDVSNLVVERNNPGGYEPINYAEATATDIETGRRVFIVLFNHPNRHSRWMEFVTPDKATFEREFGPYRSNDTAWNRWLAMSGRNRFAVAASDFVGTWSDSFGSGTSMVYAATGRSAGMLYAGGNTSISFAGGRYTMDVAGAEGMVGNIRHRTVTYSGAFTVVDNWTIEFANNFECRPRRFHASFEGIRDGRVLNLVLDEQTSSGITLHLVRVK